MIIRFIAGCAAALMTMAAAAQTHDAGELEQLRV